MGKKRKKKVGRPIVPPPMRSLRKARQITTTFHRATQAIVGGTDLAEAGAVKGRLEKAPPEVAAESHAEHHRAYQDASILTTSLHRTSKWVIHILLQERLRPKKGDPRLRLLEIGAINTQLVKCTWLATTAIDLRSTHPLIKEVDFFKFDIKERFRVVVCSMVLNCVPHPTDRGLMLKKIHTQLERGGLLFVMLPVLCFKSKYMTRHQFIQAMSYVGFEMRATKDSPKIAKFCFTRVSPGEKAHPNPLPPSLRSSAPAVKEVSKLPVTSKTFFIAFDDRDGGDLTTRQDT